MPISMLPRSTSQLRTSSICQTDLKCFNRSITKWCGVEKWIWSFLRLVFGWVSLEIFQLIDTFTNRIHLTVTISIHFKSWALYLVDCSCFWIFWKRNIHININWFSNWCLQFTWFWLMLTTFSIVYWYERRKLSSFLWWWAE